MAVVAMLKTCAADGCETKTLGRYCIEHEAASTDRPAAANDTDDGEGLARELARRIADQRRASRRSP